MREPLFVQVPPAPGRLLWEVHSREGLADMGVVDLPHPGRVVRVQFAEPIQGPMLFRGVLDLDEEELG